MARTWMLLRIGTVVASFLVLASCDGPMPGTGLSGVLEVENYNVAAGQTESVSGDVTIKASGSVNLAGSLVADMANGQDIRIQAEGDVTISGEVVAGNGRAGNAAGNIFIESINGNVLIETGASLAAGDGIAGSATSTAKTSVLQGKGTYVFKTISGGAGSQGGSVTLRAMNGDVSIADDVDSIYIGNGGDGAIIEVHGEDLLTTEMPNDLENAGGDSGDFIVEAGRFNRILVPEGEDVDLTGITYLTGGTGGKAGDFFWGEDADGNSTYPDPVTTSKILLAAKQSGINHVNIFADLHRVGAKGGDSYVGSASPGASVTARGINASAPGTDGQNALAFGGPGGHCKSPFCLEGGNGGLARATGGDGARGEHPQGAGGNGGRGDASGGLGGVGTITDGFHGNGIGIGGWGGKGGGKCPDNVANVGGRGGFGGTAFAFGGSNRGNAGGGKGGEGGDGLNFSGQVGSGGLANGGTSPGSNQVDGEDGEKGATCPAPAMVEVLVVASAVTINVPGGGSTVLLSCISGGSRGSGEEDGCDCDHQHGSITISGIPGGPFEDIDDKGCGHGCIITLPEDQVDFDCPF